MQKDERARELSDFKEKTRNVMRTFEVKARDTGTDDGRPSFLSQYAVTVTVHNIGAAFPLALDQTLEIPHGKTSHDHMAVQAFLFSIKSLVFTVERSGSGHANMQGFSFQFVDRYCTEHCIHLELMLTFTLDSGNLLPLISAAIIISQETVCYIPR